MEETKEPEKPKENFCILCGKHTTDELKRIQIGAFNHIAITTDACPRCQVVIANAGRLVKGGINRRAVEAIVKKAKEEQEKKILTPGNEEGKILRPLFIPPKDVGKKS